MPYKIKKRGAGFLVCDQAKCFSKKPIPYDNARKQRVAIALSEARKTKKPVKTFFA